MQSAISTRPGAQRARGALVICAASTPDQGTHLTRLRQEGSFRTVFPRPQKGILEAVMINTAGGVTGGDQFTTRVEAQRQARLSVTTQAAERIYRATGTVPGKITTTLTVQESAQLCWLPQETILFQGCNLDRTLSVEVAEGSRFLMVEPLVFGRGASGEDVTDGTLRDHVSITRNGKALYLDRVNMHGDLAAMLGRAAVAGGARAMASLVLVDPEARNLVAACRDLLPATAGVSAISETVLVARFLAADSFALRRDLLRVLDLLTHDTVPKNWRL